MSSGHLLAGRGVSGNWQGVVVLGFVESDRQGNLNILVVNEI